MHCIKRLIRIVQNKQVLCGTYDITQKYKVAVSQSIVRTFTHDESSSDERDEEEEIEGDEIDEEKSYNAIVDKVLGSRVDGHNVLVLQPILIYDRKEKYTTAELQLDEAVALINTLSNWKIVDKSCVVVRKPKSPLLLGSGGQKNLKNKIMTLGNVTAIFISSNALSFSQMYNLRQELRLPIFDRYSIIIHIFRQHACTMEAKIQVALAEIPYIKKRIHDASDCGNGTFVISNENKLFLDKYQAKLKKKLQKLKVHRTITKKQRISYNFPTVSMVGYTNAGKTSLIKALTGDNKLEPRDQLFATLDTTVHLGLLPSRLKVLYIDTIGFIQDVPSVLMEPFKVTLEDVISADVIIHIFDASHPDLLAQFLHVQEVIKPMIGEKKVINVANKCDLVQEVDICEDFLAVSATELTGISDLQSEIEKQILIATGRYVQRIRVKTGSPESAWIYKRTTVINAESDPQNPQYLLMDAIVSDKDIINFKSFLRKEMKS